MSAVFVNVYHLEIFCRVKFGCIVSVINVEKSSAIARIVRNVKCNGVSCLIHVIILARFGQKVKGVTRTLKVGETVP
jgi:hypothetical protein